MATRRRIFFRVMILLALVGIVWGCSGGGGGKSPMMAGSSPEVSPPSPETPPSSPEPLVIIPETKPAVVKMGSTQALVRGFVDSFLEIRRVRRAMESRSDGEIRNQNFVDVASEMPEVFSGPCGGQVTETVTRGETDGKLTVAYLYAAYCIDGREFTGKATLEVKGDVVVSGDVVAVRVSNMATYKNLVVKDEGGSVKLDGTVENISQEGESLIANHDLRLTTLGTGKIFGLLGLRTLTTEMGGESSSMDSGRIYHSDFGFMEVTTEEPLIREAANEAGFPFAGKIRFQGVTEDAKEGYAWLEAGVDGYEVTMDADGDGNWEWHSGVLSWSVRL